MTVKIKTSELVEMVEESVKRQLNEGGGRRRKAERSLTDKEYRIKKSINTMGIFTSDRSTLEHSVNRENREELTKHLKDGGYTYFPVKGYYEGKEHSFIVYNIRFEDIKNLSQKYDQDSFIFIDCSDQDNVEFQYWEQDINVRDGVYKCVDRRNETFDAKDAKDFYTQVARKFKFRIPFFETKLYEEASIAMAEDRGCETVGSIPKMLMEGSTGSSRYNNRKCLMGYFNKMKSKY